jgi:aldose 1-epimerase
MKIIKSHFGTLNDGTDVPIYTLVNDAGMEARITPYGGTVVSLTAPDPDGTMADVVLGFDTLDEYLDHSPFFGCLVGRYGNRIADGEFTLDGETYTLATNDGPNHLHGGVEGFDKKLWAASARESEYGPSLRLTYTSRDGEEGYPGTLHVTVVYTLIDEGPPASGRDIGAASGALRIDYMATTDKPTVVNLTNHSYFNLSAGEAETILDHKLMLNADHFTPVDETLIPTGEIRPVEGTPMDFRELTKVGARIDADDEQLELGGGYDHNWVLNGEPGALRLAARVVDPATGREMKVHTTEPGVQLYTGNMMPETLPGKGNRTYVRRGGLCLETQHYPDSPNHPDFPSTRLDPGETYRSTTLFAFSTQS